jgi:hypothetical protein
MSMNTVYAVSQRKDPTRNASLLVPPLGPRVLYFCSRLPRILQSYFTSMLAEQLSFGLPLGILRYTSLESNTVATGVLPTSTACAPAECKFRGLGISAYPIVVEDVATFVKCSFTENALLPPAASAGANATNSSAPDAVIHVSGNAAGLELERCTFSANAVAYNISLDQPGRFVYSDDEQPLFVQSTNETREPESLGALRRRSFILKGDSFYFNTRQVCAAGVYGWCSSNGNDSLSRERSNRSKWRVVR